MIGSTALMRNPSQKGLPPLPSAQPDDSSPSERRAADAEMARVLRTEPTRMALDSSGAGIAHRKHDPLHGVVEPMNHHVIMACTMQRMERRSGKSAAIGTFRPGIMVIIPEGSSSRWDIPSDQLHLASVEGSIEPAASGLMMLKRSRGGIPNMPRPEVCLSTAAARAALAYSGRPYFEIV